MKKKKDKHKIANILFFFSIVIILFLGYLDSVQIMSWHEVNDPDKWDKYERSNAPVFIALWFLIFLIIGIVYFLFKKDITESIALVLSSWIIIMFGLLDVGFFWFSKFTMSDNMCWFNNSGHVIARVTSYFGHQCVTAFDLYFSSIIGVILAYLIFRLLLYLEFDDIIIKRLKGK